MNNAVKIRAWFRAGESIEQIAERLSISKTSLYNLKGRNEEIAVLFKEDADIVKFEAEESLLKMVHGYTQKVNKAIKVRRIEYDEKLGRKVREYDEIVMAEEEVYVPPNVNAIIFAISNRYGEVYEKNPEVKGGNDVNVTLKVEGGSYEEQ